MPVISVARPTAYSDNAAVGVANRGGRYGEQFVSLMVGSKHPLADEGSYFVATNPTPGTALASGVNASYAATTGLISLYNSDVAGGKSLYLDYVRIIPTVAPASATAAYFALWLDKQNLYSSGGTAITPVNINGASGNTSVATLNTATGGTVLTLAALTASKRLVGRGCWRSVIPGIGDEMVISFSDAPASSGSSSGTAAGRTSTNAAPIIVAPGWGLSVNTWFPSNATTGLSYELEMAWVER